jgi:zinc transport system ATP-binding protein
VAAALEIGGLNLSIGGQEILSDISLRLDEGKFLGIVGPNGGGKTSLLRVILGLQQPGSGSVLIFGCKPHELRRGKNVFGYLPQRATAERGFPLRVIDVVMMGLYGRIGLFRWPGRSDKIRARECLDMMGIADLESVPFDRLSGGQQQRVSIARALACEPRLLVLDEPSTAIDVVGQEDFYHLLKGLQGRLAITILMVTHDIGAVTSYVDEIACLNRSLHYHGNPLGALDEGVMAGLYGKSVDILMHSAVCDKCERLRP